MVASIEDTDADDFGEPFSDTTFFSANGDFGDLGGGARGGSGRTVDGMLPGSVGQGLTSCSGSTAPFCFSSALTDTSGFHGGPFPNPIGFSSTAGRPKIEAPGATVPPNKPVCKPSFADAITASVAAAKSSCSVGVGRNVVGLVWGCCGRAGGGVGGVGGLRGKGLVPDEDDPALCC